MNQKNGKNSLGIDSCFEDLDNPIELFKKWFAKAEKTEINDPNAVAVATSNKDKVPAGFHRLDSAGRPSSDSPQLQSEN